MEENGSGGAGFREADKNVPCSYGDGHSTYYLPNWV
ncbi:MAG: hypothetical protein JWO94_2123 [Verrucomicrobiaceae bacterium]|nr:hypothetical protein [Verrucomicrobiaceae bacterium]